MKSIAAAAALLATTATATCVQDPVNNYYCDKVNAITYTNVGGKGSYNKVTQMDSTTGVCSSTPFAFSGTLSPLDEQISIHLRGPLKLVNFHVYQPKPVSRRNEHIHRHARNGHAHRARAAEPGLGDMVIATIDGKVVSWANQYAGVPAPTPAPVANPANPIAPAVANVAAAAAAPAAHVSSYTGDGWARVAAYDAAAGNATGVSFLNHLGGANGSGVFDYKFGNSLSYASASGKQGSAVPVTLANTILDDDTEVVIMSDKDCTAATCGYSRAGTVAKQGWGGAQKAFLFEFSMPDSGVKYSGPYTPKNMPAIWALNAQIPRTLQYGDAACSCWKTGCGEFDIMEVLYPGYDKAKSTLHGLKSGGDSNWLARPFVGTMKLAVLMNNDNFHIKVLADSFKFTEGLSMAQINDITTSSSTPGAGVSIFSLLNAILG